MTAPTAESTAGPARRGRPLDERHRDTILRATIEVVCEEGIAGFSVEAVAARAKVGKATVYRRWPSKEALLLDAWNSMIGRVDTPDTGSLRGDLVALLLAFEQSLPARLRHRVMPQLIAMAAIDDQVAATYQQAAAERRKPMQRVLKRAVDRGELPPDADLTLLHELFVSPMVYRWLVSDTARGRAAIERQVDMVLHGIVRR